MVERFQDILTLPDTLLNTSEYIQARIIPGMETRRKKIAPMTLDEVEMKLQSYNPRKRGEEHEWAKALHESGDGFNPDLALETADLVYYYSQPAAPRRGSLNAILFITLGDDWQRLSDGFCIVKYETRMRSGDRPDFKNIEERVMRLHLQRLARRDPYFAQQVYP